jgi:hypothetical protein
MYFSAHFSLALFRDQMDQIPNLFTSRICLLLIFTTTVMLLCLLYLSSPTLSTSLWHESRAPEANLFALFILNQPRCTWIDDRATAPARQIIG